MPVVDYLGDPLLDWGRATGPVAWVSALPDVGVLLGLKVQKIAYGFRKYPYKYRQAIGAVYSTGLKTGMAQYEGDFLRTNSRKRTQLLLRASDIELVRFYGYGNETTATREDEFYRSGQRQYLFQPRFRFGVEHVDWWIGPTVKFSHTRIGVDRFLALSRPYGVADFGQVGVGTQPALGRAQPRRARPPAAPCSTRKGTTTRRVWSAQEQFGEAHGEARAFLTAPIPLQPTLALRAAGRQVWGLYPVQRGRLHRRPGHVRGLAIQRYAGDAAAWGNAELRLRLMEMNLLVPEEMGIFGLADGGRVWLKGEDSKQVAHRRSAAGYGSPSSSARIRSAWPRRTARASRGCTSARGSRSRGGETCHKEAAAETVTATPRPVPSPTTCARGGSSSWTRGARCARCWGRRRTAAPPGSWSPTARAARVSPSTSLPTTRPRSICWTPPGRRACTSPFPKTARPCSPSSGPPRTRPRRCSP